MTRSKQNQIPNSKQIAQNLPHNFVAEKMILSCILVDENAINLVRQTLKKDAFYFQNHQQLYQIFCLMQDKEFKIDTVTVMDFLQENGFVEKVGGVAVVIELTTNVPNIIYLENYIRIINEKFLRRSLMKLSYEILYFASSVNKPLDKTLNEIEEKIFNITNFQTSHKQINKTQVLNNIFSDLKAKILTPTFLGIRTGYPKLDDLTQGFQRSDLIILAGRPSLGKTALSLNLLLNVSRRNKLPVLFFSIEMSQEQIMYRLLALESQINLKKLRAGELSETDWIKLGKVIKILSDAPFFINDNPTLSIQSLRSSIKNIYFQQKKLGLIIIDYLQLIESPNVKEVNRAQEVSKITRALKSIAREFNVPIIALSQLSRNVETRVDQKPILSDLRESGSIEQDSDLVLLLYRNRKAQRYMNNYSNNNTSKNAIDLIIAKQRNGGLGTIPLEFHPEYMKFNSLSQNNVK
mmetsp:Transcript_14989/g.41518  ORF Transcript_14989/g.41518 Transcript_14989/m.41518 type:complete len:464 (-) Transcript_14989:295-1686(-)